MSSSDAQRRGGEIERTITLLVQQAPSIDPVLVAALVAELRAIEAPAAAPLARVIADVIERVAAGSIDAGIALPALAMACTTLADGLRGTLGARELEAARYEIETLLPVPGTPAEKPIVPDVPLVQLTRERPPRT